MAVICIPCTSIRSMDPRRSDRPGPLVLDIEADLTQDQMLAVVAEIAAKVPNDKLAQWMADLGVAA